MDKAMVRGVLACLLWVAHMPATPALDSDTRKAVQTATFEFRAPAHGVRSKDLVGTAFAIGPNEFVSAAHLFDRAIGSRFGHPVLRHSSRVAYPVADILQFSEQQDYVIFSLERPPRIKPLPTRRADQTEQDVYLAGWRADGRVVIEHGTFSGVTRDRESGELGWLRFWGPLWGGVGGGPLLDDSGRVIGIVQARARNGDASYAVPIGLLQPGEPQAAHIHATEMLRSLMPVVSSMKPLEAEIPLPLSFEKFSQELQQLRSAYFDREIGPLLDATSRSFVLTGNGAAEVCNLLNGKNCECKPRAGASGVLVVDDPSADELLRQISTGKDVSRTVAGTLVLRTRSSGSGTHRPELSTDPLLHLRLALKGQAIPDSRSEGAAEVMSRVAANRDDVYTDFRDRTWHMRTWPLLDQDLELISLARKLPDGYVVLTRIMPAALSHAAELQLRVVANLVYYGCEELQGDGVARVADTMRR
ncbi:MAG: trypsin-like peptidase domain-containing protein [Steroidobacteraceae bacterium]